MFNRNKLLFFGIGSLSFALVIWVILKIFRSKMIVGLGIIATNNISSTLVLIFIIIGVAGCFIGIYPVVKDFVIDINYDKLSKSIMSYRSKSSGSNEISKQLMLMKKALPDLAVEMDGCLKLLDRMNSQFKRFSQLIKSNDAGYISTAKEGLDEVNQILCTNLKKVITSGMAIDSNNQSAVNSFYDEYRDGIVSIIVKSSKLLDKGDALLIDIANSINRKDSSGITVQLDSWREVIRGLNNDDSIKGD